MSFDIRIKWIKKKALIFGAWKFLVVRCSCVIVDNNEHWTMRSIYMVIQLYIK